MKFYKWQLPLAVVLFITGILLVSTLRALASTEDTSWRNKDKN